MNYGTCGLVPALAQPDVVSTDKMALPDCVANVRKHHTASPCNADLWLTFIHAESVMTVKGQIVAFGIL